MLKMYDAARTSRSCLHVCAACRCDRFDWPSDVEASVRRGPLAGFFGFMMTSASTSTPMQNVKL